jgi:hypothetical protein
VNTVLIITHEAQDVRDIVMPVCRRIEGVSSLRHDRFTVGKDWEFLVVPRWMLPDRIRGMRLNRVVCYDTWLVLETVTMIYSLMRNTAEPAIDYIDEPDELKRYVVEISSVQASEQEDKTRRSR